MSEHDRAQRTYQALLEEWQAAEAAARLGRGASLRYEPIRDAEIPRTQDAPGPLLLAGIGALAGLVIGLLAALVSEYRDRRVKGPEDLEHILQVPLLATLPELRRQDR